MGFFSKLAEKADFHEAGAGPNRNLVEKYGEPARSLYTEAKFTLHNRIDVTDDQGTVRYYTDSKIASLKDKTELLDATGNPVAHIEKKPVSMHEKHFIEMADGRSFTLSNELLHVVKDVTNIPELGWKLEGNIVGLNFVLFDRDERPVAAISQKLVSLRNKFSMDIYQPHEEAAVVAIVIALQKMLETRSENESESGFKFSFGG